MKIKNMKLIFAECLPGLPPFAYLGKAPCVAARRHAYADMPKKYNVTSKVLGRGMNGAVLEAIGREDTPVAGRKFAIKTLRRDHHRSLQELSIYLMLDHANIARLEDLYEDSTSLHLVMECLEGGELCDAIIEAGGFTEQMAKDVCRQMLMAVAYLHRQQPQILHRDIKPENCMLEKKYVAGSSSHNTLKLIDFGLSSQTCERGSGTPKYASPQQYRNETQYTSKDDIFSMGVTAYVLLTGKPPYTVQGTGQPGAPYEDLYRFLDRSYLTPEFLRLPAHARSFVMSLMEFNADDRPSALQALDQPWMRANSSTAAPPAISNADVRIVCDFMAESCFRRTCLNMMAWSLTSSDRERLMKRFRQRDTNNDGMISLAAVRDALQLDFDLDQKAQQVFEKLSAACDFEDKKVSYSDLLAMVLNDRVIRHQYALWGAFDRLNPNREGFVTIDGLKKVFGDTIEGVRIEECMGEVDTAGTGRISKKDFIDFLTCTSADPSGPISERQLEKTKAALANYRDILLRSAEKTITKELREEANKINSWDVDVAHEAEWVPLQKKKSVTWS